MCNATAGGTFMPIESRKSTNESTLKYDPTPGPRLTLVSSSNKPCPRMYSNLSKSDRKHWCGRWQEEGCSEDLDDSRNQISGTNAPQLLAAELQVIAIVSTSCEREVTGSNTLGPVVLEVARGVGEVEHKPNAAGVYNTDPTRN
jgi:hypothetical protein